MTESRDRRRTHLLRGLEGGNPLAFMAALGALRTLTNGWSDQLVRLSWELHGSQWRPNLHLEAPRTEREVADALYEMLSSGWDVPGVLLCSRGAADWNNLKVRPKDFAAIASGAAEHASPEDRADADFYAAVGSDAIRSRDYMDHTALRLTSGAGHQDFLPFIRILVKQTEPCQLHSALFDQWRYDDPAPSMRWDPVDDRRYALRAREPSKDKIRTVRGANRLAVAALPCFATAPKASRLATTGFISGPRRGNPMEFSWPVWAPPITMKTAESLLRHSEIVAPVPRPTILGPMGVVEVYRAKVISQDRYKNFTRGSPQLGLRSPRQDHV